MKLSIVLSTEQASFSALAYKGRLEANVAKMAALGYDGVELAIRDPACLDNEELTGMLRKQKLAVPAIGTGQAYVEDGLSFTDADETIRAKAVARIKAQVELGAQWGSKVIIGLIRGKNCNEVDSEQTLDWLVEALRQCASFAQRHSVKLALEPINRYETDLINTVSEGLKLLENVGGDNLGLLLDTFHMNIEEASIEDSIRLAGDRIFHFHVADSNRWYPGAGHIDFGRVVEALREIGYAGYLSAEILPMPDPDTCAERTIATMRPLTS